MHIDNTYEVKIIRLNNEGLGVALLDKFVVFVKNALVGEKVKIKIDLRSVFRYYIYVVCPLSDLQPLMIRL